MMLSNNEVLVLYGMVKNVHLNETFIELNELYINGKLSEAEYYIVCYIVNKLDLMNLTRLEKKLNGLNLNFNEFEPCFVNNKFEEKYRSYFVTINDKGFKVYQVLWNCKDNNPLIENKELNLETLKKEISRQ